MPIKEGGIGMFNIRNFIDALRVGIFKKSISNDNTWARELKNYSKSSCLYSNNPSLIDKNNNPIVYRIIEAYSKFSIKYYAVEGNIRDCLIFDNTLISNDAYSSISENIFSNGTWDRYRNEIKSLKLKNCLGDNSTAI